MQLHELPEAAVVECERQAGCVSGAGGRGHNGSQSHGNDGESVSINVACLDDATPDELIAAPVTYYDGLNDNWWVVPSETRHL